MNYVILRLTTGEEIVGELSQKDENSLTIKNALQVKTKYNEFGIPSIYMTKYCMFAEDYDVVFPYKQINQVLKPMRGMIEYYNANLKYVKEQMNGIIDKDLQQAARQQNNEVEDDHQTMENLLQFSGNTTIH